MGSFIAKQPNGLYCRFSTVTDCPTTWNMTEEEYLELCAERGRQEGREVLANYVRPFSRITESFSEENMTRGHFEEIKRRMAEPRKAGETMVTE